MRYIHLCLFCASDLINVSVDTRIVLLLSSKWFILQKQMREPWRKEEAVTNDRTVSLSVIFTQLLAISATKPETFCSLLRVLIIVQALYQNFGTGALNILDTKRVQSIDASGTI